MPMPAAATDVFDQFAGRSLSLAQTCSALNISRRTVYYLIKGGRLRTIRTQMGSQRVLVDSLKAYWQERV